MKFLLLILAFALLSGCANLTTTDGTVYKLSVNSSNQMASPDANANYFDIEEEENIDGAERASLEAQNDKFRTPPDSFKNIDFKNRLYPYNFSDNNEKSDFQLEDGEFIYEFDVSDRGFINYKDVFYVDLTGDETKEAIVFLNLFRCATGCDGGAAVLYIYAIENNKPKLIWQYETGGMAYGEGLKSLKIKDKKLTIESFGKCEPNTGGKDMPFIICSKFIVEDVIVENYDFENGKFVQRSKRKIETPVSSIWHYQPVISIND